MQKTTTQQLHAMTQHERKECIRQILAPMTHRGHLHLPKQDYFEGLYGLTALAHDLSHWMALSEVSVRVIEHDKPHWTLDYTDTSATISLPKNLVTDAPFFAHYMIVLAVCTLAKRIRLADDLLSLESEQQLVEHLSISAGCGVYGVNARHNAPSHHAHTRFVIPQQHYQDLFQSYCREHAIPLTRYEQHLLPAAQHALHTHSPKNSRKAFIQRFLRSKHVRTYRTLGYAVGLVSMLMALSVLWHYVPRPLTPEQRSIQADIKMMRQEYALCQQNFQNMQQIAAEPDILRTRSLQLQLRQCEELKQAHNQLVSTFNQSL